MSSKPCSISAHYDVAVMSVATIAVVAHSVGSRNLNSSFHHTVVEVMVVDFAVAVVVAADSDS